MVMNALVNAVKATGTLGVVGVFIPQDPKAEDALEKKGQIAFDMGKFWFKGQKMGTGQCNVKVYNRRLMDLIHQPFLHHFPLTSLKRSSHSLQTFRQP